MPIKISLDMQRWMKAHQRETLVLPKEPAKPAEPTKQYPECLDTVPAAAKKCRTCTSLLA